MYIILDDLMRKSASYINRVAVDKLHTYLKNEIIAVREVPQFTSFQNFIRSTWFYFRVLRTSNPRACHV